MDVDRFIGGIEISGGDTIITGGSVERVVNTNSKFHIKDRLMEYKHSKKDDIKELLHVIGLSIPITFDPVVYYDDQGPEKYDKHKRTNNHGKVLTMVKNRLMMPLSKLVQLKIREYDLKEPAELAMAEFIAYMARYVKRNNGKANMRKIKISYNVGQMLDEIGRAHV